jgi:chaperonin GroEL
MSERTAGGLFLPDEQAISMLATPVREAVEPGGEGLVVHAGHVTPFFVTNPSTWVAELDRPRVFVSSEPLEAVQALVPLFESAALAAEPVAVFAPTFSAEVVAFLMVNKLRGILFVDAIATSQLHDVAALLGVTARADVPTDQATLPRARRVVSGARTTLITA